MLSSNFRTCTPSSTCVRARILARLLYGEPPRFPRVLFPARPPRALKWTSWWAGIGGSRCLVSASPDGLSFLARQITSSTKKERERETFKARRTTYNSVGFVGGRPHPAGRGLIEVQLFPQTSLTLANDERKHC